MCFRDFFSCPNDQVPNCGRKIKPSDKLALIGNAVCETCSLRTTAYEWKILVKSGDDYRSVPDVTNILSTPLNSRTLSVKPDMLKGGKTYKFRLESWVKSSNKEVYGFAEYVKEVNMPPVNGSCDVTPKLGYAFQADFRISCSGWVDDTKLIYSVTARVDTGKAELPVSPAETLSVDQSYTLTSKILPVGLTQRDYWIDVIITIKDEDDASIQVPVPVQVRPRGILHFMDLYGDAPPERRI